MILLIQQNDFEVKLYECEDKQEDTLNCTETLSGKLIREFLRKGFNSPLFMPTGSPRQKTKDIWFVAK